MSRSPEHQIGLPDDGVVRVHRDPVALPPLGDLPGPHRFDDPRPRSIERFGVRYAASTLRGSMLELLDWLRPDPAAAAAEAAVECNDPSDDDFDGPTAGQALEAFLGTRRVVTLTGARLSMIRINAQPVLSDLNREPAVRAVLDADRAREQLGAPSAAAGRAIGLDNAMIRLGSELGRDLTQACSLALHDRVPQPDGIAYASRHDDDERCWAIYDHARVIMSEPVDLSPADTQMAAVVREIAALWSLELPTDWQA